MRYQSTHHILVINVGSTSTKLGVYTDREFAFRETIEHTKNDLSTLSGHDQWFRFHREVIQNTLSDKRQEFESPDLVVSRGGLTKPVNGGAYRVNQAMINDLRAADYGWHPTNVAPAIAREVASDYGVKAIVYDTPVVDEMSSLARFSGLKGINRRAALHVLSQKSAGRKAAGDLGIPYNQGRLIVAHMGGGITVGAHKESRIIDGTHGLSEGPFTPQRAGALPVLEVIELCFSGDYSKEQLTALLHNRAGLHSYLGDHDMAKAESSVSEGNQQVLLVIQAMAYQISKDICAMAAVLEGRVDAVVLTGNLCRAHTLVDEIQRRVSFLGKILVYPGEDELENLAMGGLAVLAGQEPIKEYE